MAAYDHPNFLVIRERALTGAISAAGLDSAYVGASLKVAQKAIVLGVTLEVGSGGSAAGTNSIRVSRMNAAGTLSNHQTHTVMVSAGASAVNDVIDISLSVGMTIHSLAEAAVLRGNAASLDKAGVLKDVIWRYRLLPPDVPQNANQS